MQVVALLTLTADTGKLSGTISKSSRIETVAEKYVRFVAQTANSESHNDKSIHIQIWSSLIVRQCIRVGDLNNKETVQYFPVRSE